MPRRRSACPTCCLQRPQAGGRHRPATEEPEGPYRLAQQWRRAQEDLQATRDDPELADLALDPADVARLEEELKLALVEADPADHKDVPLDSPPGGRRRRGGAWAGDVFRMLTRYAERRLRDRAALVEPERRRRLQGDRLRGQGRDGAYSVFKWGRRHAPRAARPDHRVAGAHPHLDCDGGRDAGGGGGSRSRSIRTSSRSTFIVRQARAGRA